MPTHTVNVLLAASPAAPGAPELLERAEAVAARPGGLLRVLLTGPGVAWASSPRLASLAAQGADVALCSLSAQGAGLGPETVPEWLRWSSLVSWLVLVGEAAVWGAFE